MGAKIQSTRRTKNILHTIQFIKEVNIAKEQVVSIGAFLVFFHAFSYNGVCSEYTINVYNMDFCSSTYSENTGIFHQYLPFHDNTIIIKKTGMHQWRLLSTRQAHLLLMRLVNIQHLIAQCNNRYQPLVSYLGIRLCSARQNNSSYSGDLNSELVRYSNGPKQFSCQMVRYSGHRVFD